MDNSSDKLDTPDALARLFERAGQIAAGKRRTDTRGGWRGSERSRANLALGGWDRVAMCEKCRGQPAVRGSRFCRRHGGAVRLHFDGRTPPHRALHSAIRSAEKAGAIPRGLIDQPIYRAVRARRWRASSLAMELIAAWRAFETGDVAAWHAAIRKAREAGFGHGA